MPDAFTHDLPSSRLAYTPSPVGVKIPPTALSPVPARIVPPFAVEKPRPPIACAGMASPIDRQEPPPAVDSQTPPVAGAAKIRLGFRGSYANAVTRPERPPQPSALGPERTAFWPA